MDFDMLTGPLTDPNPSVYQSPSKQPEFLGYELACKKYLLFLQVELQVLHAEDHASVQVPL